MLLNEHMGMFLYKSAQQLFYPLNFSLFLLFISFLLLRNERRRNIGYLLGIFSFSFLLFCSFPPVARFLLGHLENRYPWHPLEKQQTAKAIVVLGGTVSSLGTTSAEVEEVEGSRLVPAYRLFQMKKAPVIIVSGGNPYPVKNQIRNEAIDMRDYLMNLGVPEKAILLEDESRTTLENAQHVSRRLKIVTGDLNAPILLVTSAFHMARSQKAFEKFGVKTIPVPVSHFVVETDIPLWQNFPNSKALYQTTVASKEFLGLLWYQIF